uniref:Ferredoxin--NADP reductase 2 n=1 Tax=Lygus hesperus TaxID=30085 RepID=A0A0A9X8Y7_LYGHE
MENMMRKRNVMAALIIKEMIDGDEEEELILTKYAKVRKRVSDVFSNRRNEGMFSSLNKNHLLDDEEKFQSYFRLTRERFFFILNIINLESKTIAPAYCAVDSSSTSLANHANATRSALT